MRNVWIGLAAASTGFLAYAAIEPRTRLEQLERLPRTDPSEVVALRAELERLRDELSTSHAALAAAAQREPLAESVRSRADELERALRDAACAADEQRERLARLELERELVPLVIEERVTAASDAAAGRLERIHAEATAARDLATAARTGADEALRALVRDEDRMWRDLLGPTVRIDGEETVGSGILLASEPSAVAGEHETFVLTAWHVIRDLEKDGALDAIVVPVSIFAPDGEIEIESARVAGRDVRLDIALLKLDATRAFPFGARLAPRESLERVRIFDRIYAVGCPLGNDPIPTFGEVADVRHHVDGQRFWMISAPTYIGNSGGGVFDATTHEVVGLFTKIYTHGSLRPSVVPHMGLATPLADVYDWLETSGFSSLEPGAARASAATAVTVR